jgi:hypothetical protein
MSDITDVFSRVAGEPGDPAADIVDGDIARGHRALQQSQRRRRMRRSAITATSVAAVAAVIVVGAQLHDGSAKQPASTAATHHSATKVTTKQHVTTPKTHVKTVSSIKLVAYHGKQLHGFTVDKVPTGWFLSTSTQYALLIDPAGSTDSDPDVFVGKLAVLTQSSDVHSLPKGTAVTVNGEPGTVADQGKYGLSLAYNTPNGIGTVIQAPAALNWTDAQLVKFAEGVHMTGNAVAGRG